MTPTPILRPAGRRDLEPVLRLLDEAGLPRDGLEGVVRLTVAEENGRVVGAVAFEAYGGVGLLRSLVVAPDRRGAGLGLRLLQEGLAAMARSGIRDAYGLTTTIPDWLARLGWRELERPAAPAALGASREMRGACPATARLFHLPLPSPPRAASKAGKA